MNFLQNLKIGMRLGAAFGTVLLLLIGIAVFGSLNVDRVHDNVDSMYHENVLPLQNLGKINALLLRNRVLVMDMMAHPEPANVEKRDAELRANIDTVSKVWEKHAAADHTPKEKALVEEFARARAAYVGEGLLAARDAMRAGKPDEADRIYRGQISPLAATAQAALDKLLQNQVDEASADLAAATQTENSVYRGTAIMTVLALLLGAFFAWAAARSITRPVAEAVRFAQSVAAGDLTRGFPVTSNDEIGHLLSSLAQMQTSLATVVGTVRGNAEQRGHRQRADRPGQQGPEPAHRSSRPARLQQTAASMEQLGSTVQAERRQRPAGQPAGARAPAAWPCKGGEVVGQVVDTMKGINDSSQARSPTSSA